VSEAWEEKGFEAETDEGDESSESDPEEDETLDPDDTVDDAGVDPGSEGEQ
jgi:hypothetical protein